MVSAISSACVDAVETVTTFFVASQVTTFVLTVVKLCCTPVPIPVKYRSSVDAVVFATPVNVPVLPSPTLTVAIPIKSSEILAIKTGVSSPNLKVVTPVGSVAT